MKKWLEIKSKRLRKPKNQSNGMKKINSLKLNLNLKKMNKIITFKIKTILIPTTKLLSTILVLRISTASKYSTKDLLKRKINLLKKRSEYKY